MKKYDAAKISINHIDRRIGLRYSAIGDSIGPGRYSRYGIDMELIWSMLILAVWLITESD